MVLSLCLKEYVGSAIRVFQSLTLVFSLPPLDSSPKSDRRLFVLRLASY